MYIRQGKVGGYIILMNLQFLVFGAGIKYSENEYRANVLWCSVCAGVRIFVYSGVKVCACVCLQYKILR